MNDDELGQPTVEQLLTLFEPEDLASRITLGKLHRDYRADRHRWIDALRVRAPAFRNARHRTGILTLLEDANTLLRDRSASSDPKKSAALAPRQVFRHYEGKQHSMLVLDDPEHGRLRRLVAHAFTPRAIEAMRPRIAAIADTLIDQVAERDEFDLIEDYSAVLPVQVIAEMLGVDPSDRVQFRAWSRDFVLLFNVRPAPEQEHRIQLAGAALLKYFTQAVEERRTRPGEDLITAMVRAEEDGGKLTAGEIVTMCMLILLGGNLTTTDLIGNGVVALLTHPAQLARLRAEPGLIVNAVEEMLRFDGPVEAVTRTLLEPRTIRGCPFAAGDSVTASLVAAAHDPKVTSDPHTFDITRHEPQHLSFGAGIHYCIGAPLARLEAQIAIGKLLERFPDLRLTGTRLHRRTITTFSGFETVPVRIR